MPTPIWKDTEITIASTQTCLIQVLNGTTPIFSGRAVARPGEGSIRVRMNDICRAYLKQVFPTDVATGYEMCASLQQIFKLQKRATISDSWTDVSSLAFDYDWSYVNNVTSKKTVIQNIAVPGMYLLYTSGAMNYIKLVPNNVETIQGDNGVTYTVDPCHRFALYFVNAYGGWDSLAISGKSLKSEAYERKTIGRVYDNSVIPEQPGTVVQSNDVKRRWELHTDWLTDEQAALMHHLLGSNQVYLHDIGSEIMPVTIQNTDCVYKQFATNGHKMASYVITVENAQSLIRR